MPPSLAREFFDRITKVGDKTAVIGAIRALINSDPPTFEGDSRDFKTEPKGNPKQKDDGYREVWSKLLGGFANVGGGVVIWGVDARKKDRDGVEVNAACEDKPIAAPHALKAKLVEWLRDATEPLMTGVEVESYELDGGKGYVVCFVPEGAVKPYESRHACRAYFMRAGDNTVVMPRSLLQSLFFPRAKAVFDVRMSLQHMSGYSVGDGEPAKWEMKLQLANIGSATAKDIMMSVGAPAVLHQFGKRDTGPGWTTQGQYLHRVTPLHPSMPHESVCTMAWKYGPPAPGSVLPGSDVKVVTFTIAVFAHDQEPQTFKAEFGLDILHRDMRQNALVSMLSS